jgi:hypothetical protein
MISKLFAGLDWRHWLLSHAVWIAAIAVALVLGHSYVAEHDARILADAQIKMSEANIKNLTDQIAATNAAAAQRVQTIVKIVHDASTPTQVVAAVPQLTNVPLNTRVAPDNPQQVSVDALPFLGLLGQAKTDAVNLAACQSNLKDETAIVTQKQIEIVALKKKPAFWKRASGVAKAVGVGIGIGLLISGHL